MWAGVKHARVERIEIYHLVETGEVLDGSYLPFMMYGSVLFCGCRFARHVERKIE
jgi:hypothetical protein